MALSYNPITPFLLGHGGEAHGDRPAKRPRTVSHAILRPFTSLAERLEDLCALVYMPAPPRDDAGESSELDERLAREIERMKLENRMNVAKDYEEWEIAALQLDEFEGHDAWKKEEASADYDVQTVKEKVHELERIRDSGDVGAMLMYVRTSLARDAGGIGNPRLYRQSRIGTKELVERYVTGAVDLIRTTVRMTASGGGAAPWDPDKVRDMWLKTRQSFGRSALLLSGGGTLGMCHVGVVKALYEADALPRIISGTSAGSIVAAVCCVKTDDEVPTLLREFCHGELDVFTNKDSLSHRLSDVLKHLLTEGNLYDIQNLNRVMKQYMGDLTFLEAYNKTKKILNVCVSNADPREQNTAILNYVTAPNVLVWSAVAASCSVPLVYSPAKLYEKHPRTGELKESSQSWIDGSVVGDVPMDRLSELFDVNHFIVSQVNPHVLPFLVRDDDVPVHEGQDDAPTFKAAVLGMAKTEMLFRLKMSAEMGFFPTVATRLRSILGQSYQGDINILPKVPHLDYLRVLTNPTPEYMFEACAAGEHATWPKINRIRSRCAIEHAIERAVREACGHAEFSASKVDLRRCNYHKTMYDSQLRGSKARSLSRGPRHSLS